MTGQIFKVIIDVFKVEEVSTDSNEITSKKVL